jgi:hypothetical protein
LLLGYVAGLEPAAREERGEDNDDGNAENA